jgi:hypothetical protein
MTGLVIPDVSKDCDVFIFRVRQPMKNSCMTSSWDCLILQMKALQSFERWAFVPSCTASHPRRLESTLDAVDPVWGLLQRLEVGCVASVLEELAAFIFRVKVVRICVKY